MEALKEIIEMFKKNPGGVICTFMAAGMYMFYTDGIDFIKQQQEALREIAQTQQSIVIELRELNTRINELEHNTPTKNNEQ